MALRCTLRDALRCTPRDTLFKATLLKATLRTSMPASLRAMSSQTDQMTAELALGALGASPDVFDTPPPPPEKAFMHLPPVGTYRRGPRHEPLLNVPPSEDPLLYFLTSMVMKHGERAKARRIVSKTLTYIYTFTRAPPLPILREAVLLASPAVRTCSFTHGAKAVQIPFALSEKQRTRYGIEWLLKSANARTGSRLAERLAREMVDVVQRTAAARDYDGDPDKAPKPTGTLAKKAEVHTFAMVNRGGVRVNPAELQQQQ